MTTRRDVLRQLTGIAVLGALPLNACSDGGDDGGGFDAGGDGATRDATTNDATTSDATTDATTDATDDGGGGTCDSVSFSNVGHTHVATIPPADVAAGEPMTYTMTGSGHTHTIMVTAAMFTMLQNGEDVTFTSSEASNGPHTHEVTLRCG